MTVKCTCEDCIHCENSECTLDEITIDDNTMTDAGFLPLCADYKER